MDLKWNDEARSLYEKANEELLSERSRVLAFLGAMLFPLFFFLDYFTQYHALLPLSIIRFSCTGIFLLSYFALKYNWFNLRPLYSTLFLFLVATIGITLMCDVLGGFVSPYYGGINLILIAATLILTVDEKKMLFYVLLTVSLYFFPLLLREGFTISNHQALINNMCFLTATGIISVAAAYLTSRLREQSFIHNYLLERAQNSLRHELTTSQGSIESLVHDIAQRRVELEKALGTAEEAHATAQRALQLREEFISLASHELNTPLTSLKLQTDLHMMKIKKTPAADVVEGYSKIVSIYDFQLKRLIRMVEDMLDVSRIKKGKLELEKSRIDLHLLIEGIINRTAKELYAKTPDITFHSQGPIEGEWDFFRLEQVVLNLLTNAMKYGDGKPVEVKLLKQNNVAVIQVKDLGIGIPLNKLQAVFEQFERAVTSSQYTGLGLGLYISRQIVEAHGGRISVQSTPGEGSVFEITLPL